MIVRDENEEDRGALDALHRAAFGGGDEMALVHRLHDEDLVALSLVATIGGHIVGHALFSRLDMEIDGRKVRALALAPMAVVPLRQRQGVGTRLMGESLLRLGKTRYEAVIVVGHEDYYPRFGFSSELARKLASPFQTDAFMALELKEGALEGEKGRVIYPPAFGLDGTASA
ncbi:MAG: hypothetical protein RJB62_1511 [Pseudomonadota bacterium]